jgi:tetratricopeptide (TPR) repeat protein
VQFKNKEGSLELKIQVKKEWNLKKVHVGIFVRDENSPLIYQAWAGALNGRSGPAEPEKKPEKKTEKEPSEDAKIKSAAFYQEGLRIQKQGDIPGAILKYEEALKLDPKNWACLNHYAWFLGVDAKGGFRDLKKALVLALRSAEASNWKNKDVIDTVAEVYFQKKEYEQAVKYGKMALKPGLVGNCKQNYLEKQLLKFTEALK